METVDALGRVEQVARGQSRAAEESCMRGRWIGLLGVVAAAAALAGCADRPTVQTARAVPIAAPAKEAKQVSSETKTETPFPIVKSEEEWRKELTPEQYHILREKGTE